MSGQPGKLKPHRYWLNEAEFAAHEAIQRFHMDLFGDPRTDSKPIVRVKAKSEKVRA